MIKERIIKEREERKKEKLRRAKFEKPQRQLIPKERVVREIRDLSFKKEYRPKDKDEVFKRRATVSGPEIIIPLEKESLRRVHAKKIRKKIDLEKPLKTKKIVDRRDTEEAIDLDEIKKEIKLEKLKEKVLDREKIKVKTEKRKKVVYKDDKDFGSVFASKLDEIVKKQDEIKGKKKGKKSKK